MNYWFTSDTHFGHANIIKYCNRPFANVKEMDDAIIENWNKVVKHDDCIYHLGDFCFGRDERDFNSYFRRLNGKIILIKGNHDKLTWRYRNAFFASYNSYNEIDIEGQKITLCHYAMKVWNKSHRGAWHLYGHSHGSLPDDKNSLSFDVGVDCHEFKPINIEDIRHIMSKKTFKPIDHHGDRPHEKVVTDIVD